MKIRDYKVKDVWINGNRTEYLIEDTDGKTFVIGVKPTETLTFVMRYNNFIKSISAMNDNWQADK